MPCHRDTRPKDPSDFDPVAASETMRAIAELVEQAGIGTELQRDFASTAIDQLRTAQEWLDARFADFDLPSQRPLVTADEEPERIGVEALVYTLRYAAIELLQVHKLLELRGYRRKNDGR